MTRQPLNTRVRRSQIADDAAVALSSEWTPATGHYLREMMQRAMHDLAQFLYTKQRSGGDLFYKRARRLESAKQRFASCYPIIKLSGQLIDAHNKSPVPLHVLFFDVPTGENLCDCELGFDSPSGKRIKHRHEVIPPGGRIQ